MIRIKDLTGQKFNRLTAISFAGKDSSNNARWLFKCDCGNTVECRGSEVSRGTTKSCGCLVSEKTKESNTTHNMSRTRTYKTWISMRSRCNNPTDKFYEYYGARGITVCKEWDESFEVFYSDMGDQPDGLSIDRIDNNKGYSKENCRWATSETQQRNKRNSKYWYIDGVRYDSHTQAAKELGVGYRTVIEWCEGYTDKRSGRFIAPKPNCYSELKYKETNQ